MTQEDVLGSALLDAHQHRAEVHAIRLGSSARAVD
jgi:hypothetical protein